MLFLLENETCFYYKVLVNVLCLNNITVTSTSQLYAFEFFLRTI